MPRIPIPPKVSVKNVARRVTRENNAVAKGIQKARDASLKAAERSTRNLERYTGVSAEDAARHLAQDNAGANLTNDSFQNFALSLGMGTDNTMSASTYGFNPITRQRILLEWLYRGTWLGGVAVDVVADDMIRAGINLKGQIEPNDIEKLDELAGILGIWESLGDSVRWSRLYGGSLAVMMIENQRYDTPLRLETIGKGDFRGLMVLDRWMVEPDLGNLVQEQGPNLGLPKFYRVVDDAPIRVNQKIHYSRCLRLEGVRLPYYQRLMENLWGMSEVERIYDRLTMFDAATAGASQLMHKSFLRTLKIAGLRAALANGGNAAKGVLAQISMMRRFQQNEGISVVDGEDDFTIDQSSGISGMADMLERFGEQLSGALQIPLVRLFGQSPAGFSSGESDLRMYYDGIKQKQNRHLRLPLVRIYRAMARSLGLQLPPGFNVHFNPLWQLTEKEQAETAVVTTNAVNEALSAGIIDKPTAMRELRQSAEITGIFSNITDEAITAAENEEKISDPPTPGLEELQAGTSGHAITKQGGSEGKETEPNGQPDKFASVTASTKPKALPKPPAEVPSPLSKGEENGSAESPAHEGGKSARASEEGEEAEDAALPSFDGLDYVVETPRGAIRQPWGVTMPEAYGYIKGTGSAEGWGEGMDVYIGRDAKAKNVYVVHQKDLDSGEFDEHKCLIGFPSAASALDCYIKSFNDGKGQQRVLKAEVYSLDRFKKWLHDNWRAEQTSNISSVS